MLTVATALVVVGLPMTLLVTLLLATGRIERAREARIAWQVGLTDAIHRELGAVVAPVVRRRFPRGWRVEIAVPFESPAIVGRVVAIAHAVMSPAVVEIALTAQEPGMQRANVRKLQPVGTSPLAGSEVEAVAWTGTTTSRAS